MEGQWGNILRRNVVRKKIPNGHDLRSLQRLVKPTGRKTTVELTGMLHGNIISMHTMRKELKGLGLHNSVGVRQPLISEADWKKKVGSIC